MRQWSPEPVAHLSQNRLLPLLRSSAARFPELCTVAFGHRVDQMQQDRTGVSTRVCGAAATGTIRSRFAIACERPQLCTPVFGHGPDLIQKVVLSLSNFWG